MKSELVQSELRKYASTKRAIASQRFFKTGEGQYGEGDVFIGVNMPDTRKVCRLFQDLPPNEVQNLLNSKFHEDRMAGVVILANQFKKSDKDQRKKTFELYIKNVRGGRINNWDLIDVTCPHVVGAYLLDKPKSVLFDMARSNSVWQRRVSIISTFAFIAKGEGYETLKLAEILLKDEHDLIQKAVGWSLREVGKRVDRQLLLGFLDRHAHEMPRTELRYAIEHLDYKFRNKYMLAQKNKLTKV